MFERSFKVEISSSHNHYTSNVQRRYTLLKLVVKMCFKHRKEQPSRTVEGQSDIDCQSSADEIDGKGEHILKTSDHLSSEESACQFDVCGNYRCLCEICTTQAQRNVEKAMNYRLLHLKTENEKFKTSVICKNCKSNSVEILTLPCSHIVCCENCADILDNCPLCDDRILGTVRIYMG